MLAASTLSGAVARADEPAELAPVVADDPEVAAAPEVSLASDAAPEPRPRGSRRRRHGIAAVEELIGLGIGATWYWISREQNLADWDIDSIHQRFSADSFRLDTNSMAINFLWHPLSGAAYYGLPRANGLSMPTSAAYGLLTCLVWEYGLEFREKLSINDVITTPLTGIAVGEFLSRFALYMNRIPGGGSPEQRILGAFLGPTQAMHDAGYRFAGVPADAPRDSLGHDASLAHRFVMDVGAAFVATPGRESRGGFTFGFEGELFAMPGFLRDDRQRRGFFDAERSSMRMRFTLSRQVRQTELAADAILVGGHFQRMHGPTGARRGRAVTIGTHLAYRYRRDALPGYRDALGATGLPGFALEVDVVRPKLAFHLGGRLEGQFAGVNAPAYDAWAVAHPGVVTKHVLRAFDYYYAWGLGARASARLEVPHVVLEVAVDHARYRSQEGLDRAQEELDVDLRGRARLIDVEARLRVRPIPRRALYLEASVGRRLRDDTLAGLRTERRLDRLGVVLGTLR